MAFFTSRADLNVGIVNQYVLNSNGIVQGQGQQIINFFDPTGGLPVAPNDGDRYIATATANGWILNNIEVYDDNLGTWKNIVPIAGTLAWLTGIAAPQLRVWNPTSVAWETPVSAMGAVQAVPSTDNAIVRFNGTQGQVQNTGVTIDDSNNVTGFQNANFSGNVFVGGTITSTTTQNLVVADRFINLNNGYISNTGQTTGTTMNYKSTGVGTTSIAPGFTQAVPAVSDASVATADAGPLWVTGDIVQVSESLNNDGLYEVQNHAANVLTLKSIGINHPTVNFVQDQVISEATVGANIYGVNITVLQTSTTGLLETATGNTAADFVFSPIGGGIVHQFITPGTTVNDVPANVSNVRITMIGGGGGSGTSTSTYGSGAGGSGMAIVGWIHRVTPIAGSMTITVGDGGTADGFGGNSIVAYTGTNPFTITAYGGSPGGKDNGNFAGGGSGSGAGGVGTAGIPTNTGLGGPPSFTGFIQGPAGAPGGNDMITDGVLAQPGAIGQQYGFVIAGSGGSGSGTPGANGMNNVGGPGGIALGNAGASSASYFGSGANGAPNIIGTQGSPGQNNTGVGAGGSYNAPGSQGGSGFVVLEYF